MCSECDVNKTCIQWLLTGERATGYHPTWKFGHQGVPWCQETGRSCSIFFFSYFSLSLSLSFHFMLLPWWLSVFSSPVLLWDIQLAWAVSQWPGHQGLQNHRRRKSGNWQPRSLPYPGQEQGGNGGMDEADQGQHFLQPLPWDIAAAETAGQPERTRDALVMLIPHLPVIGHELTMSATERLFLLLTLDAIKYAHNQVVVIIPITAHPPPHRVTFCLPLLLSDKLFCCFIYQAFLHFSSFLGV